MLIVSLGPGTTAYFALLGRSRTISGGQKELLSILLFFVRRVIGARLGCSSLSGKAGSRTRNEKETHGAIHDYSQGQ
jgi:hypothetical protein